MKILILANKPPYPSKDGSSLATLSMAKGLANSGNNVTILASSTNKHQCRIEQIPNELRQLINFSLVDIDTSISPIKGIVNLLFSKLPYNISRFINTNYSKKLIGIIKEGNFDLIQLEGLYLAPYIQIIKKNTSTPIVYRSHNIEHEIWSRLSLNEKNPLKSRYYAILSKRIRRIEERISSQVEALVAISKRDEQWFRSNGLNKPSTTIPMGYSIPNSEKISGLSNDEPCFLGSLDWLPNQEGLTWFIDKIWPIILKEFPNLNFHVAGRNAPAWMIERLKKENRIIFHGEVDNAQAYLSNYSIIVVPILSGSGMRVKIVEGMMLGKVIVTTSIGIEGIDATNNEHAIIVDTPTDFAKAVIELIHQPSLKSNIAEKSRIFASDQFDNIKLTGQLENFYKTLV